MTRQHRRRLEWENQKQAETQEAQPPPPSARLPGKGGEELRELLQEKARFQQFLQSQQRRPVHVTIDALGDSWIWVVRGMKPPMGWWAGYPVFWVDASPVAALG